VHIRRLLIDQLRCLNKVELTLTPGLHVFIGPNGSGKTSVLEAVALLGSGRSFRAGGKDALIARGADKLSVFAELEIHSTAHQIGFERAQKAWRGRLNGNDISQLTQLVRLAPIWVVEPNSHELISGGSEPRRALIDWLLFHVEPPFAGVAARYKAALRQRNVLLKSESDPKELEPWTTMVVSLGMELAALRDRYIPEWINAVRESAARLLPELGAVALNFKSGWPSDQSPSEATAARLARDRALGYTSAGPHRADWSLIFAHAPEREQFSRGQAKNACLAVVFGTLARYHALSGEKPVLCLDDLFSELDQDHQAHCLRLAFQIADQVLVTGVALSDAIAAWPGHVYTWKVSKGTVITQGN
jgi:DNA replication and repair protein RecF